MCRTYVRKGWSRNTHDSGHVMREFKLKIELSTYGDIWEGIRNLLNLESARFHLGGKYVKTTNIISAVWITQLLRELNRIPIRRGSEDGSVTNFILSNISLRPYAAWSVHQWVRRNDFNFNYVNGRHNWLHYNWQLKSVPASLAPSIFYGTEMFRVDTLSTKSLSIDGACSYTILFA